MLNCYICIFVTVNQVAPPPNSHHWLNQTFWIYTSNCLCTFQQPRNYTFHLKYLMYTTVQKYLGANCFLAKTWPLAIFDLIILMRFPTFCICCSLSLIHAAPFSHFIIFCVLYNLHSASKETNPLTDHVSSPLAY